MAQAKWFENTLLLPQCDKIRTKKGKKRGRSYFSLSLSKKNRTVPFFYFFLSPFFLVFSRERKYNSAQ
jgi:hypothetical protein